MLWIKCGQNTFHRNDIHHRFKGPKILAVLEVQISFIYLIILVESYSELTSISALNWNDYKSHRWVKHVTAWIERRRAHYSYLKWGTLSKSQPRVSEVLAWIIHTFTETLVNSWH